MICLTRSVGTGLGILVVGSLLGSGCRKESTAGSATESPVATSAAQSAPSGSACGYTTADAASFLGTPAESITAKSEQTTPNLLVCSFTPKGAAEGVSFSLRRDKSAEAAAADYERLKDHLLSDDVQPAAEEKPGESALIETFGLGDEALWTNTNRTLTVRRGALTVVVMAPRDDRRRQYKVAEVILKRVP